MTYKQLQDEVIALRFNEGKRASVKSWINLRYSYLWDYANWSFKRITAANLAATASRVSLREQAFWACSSARPREEH